jgi:hypothetical protein
MRTPTIHLADNIKKWDATASYDGIHWYLARSEGYPGINLWFRLQLAWLVFTGRCDALEWVEE